MRHYEIVFLIHPEQSEQVPAMVERYKETVTRDGGKIHRLEDWGRQTLAYRINRAHKAHYILMNIEAGEQTLRELTTSFTYNDAILRNLVIRQNKAVTQESPMMQKVRKDREEEQKEEERLQRLEQSAKKAPAAREQETEPGTAPDEDAKQEAKAEAGEKMAEAEAGEKTAEAEAGEKTAEVEAGEKTAEAEAGEKAVETGDTETAKTDRG